jgi:mannose-6-phosphate isomerase
VIADATEFRIRRLPLAAGDTVHFRAREEPRILSVVTGSLKPVGDPKAEELKRGDNVVLPYAGDFVFQAGQSTMLLVTEKFA